MTPGRDLWDTIAIVIALDSLHEDFNTTTASLLETGDKTINQIQSILQSKEAKNISKQATGKGIGNLAIAFRNNNAPKRKANSHEECYNCHKLGHFGRDCPLPDRRLNRLTQRQRESQVGRGQSRRCTGSRNKSHVSNRAHQTAELKVDYNNSDQKTIYPRPNGNRLYSQKSVRSTTPEDKIRKHLVLRLLRVSPLL